MVGFNLGVLMDWWSVAVLICLKTAHVSPWAFWAFDHLQVPWLTCSGCGKCPAPACHLTPELTSHPLPSKHWDNQPRIQFRPLALKKIPFTTHMLPLCVIPEASLCPGDQQPSASLGHHLGNDAGHLSPGRSLGIMIHCYFPLRFSTSIMSNHQVLNTSNWAVSSANLWPLCLMSSSFVWT